MSRSRVTILTAVIATALIWPAAADEVLVGTEVCTTDGNTRTCQVWVNMDAMLRSMDEQSSRILEDIQKTIEMEQALIPVQRPAQTTKHSAAPAAEEDDSFAAMVRSVERIDGKLAAERNASEPSQ